MNGGERWDSASLKLIAVTDSVRDGLKGLASRVFSAVHGGATMVHVRLPGESPRVVCEAVRAIRAVVQVPVMVSARFDVAVACGADGVYLELDDVTADAVRRVAPRELVIGVSVNSDLDVVRATQADFVGIGPVYARTDGEGQSLALGLDGFSSLAIRAGRPAVAIGGIDVSNVAQVMSAGAAGIAVISALFGAPDPAASARALRLAQDASGR